MTGILFVFGFIFVFLALSWAVYKSYPTKKDVKGSEE